MLNKLERIASKTKYEFEAIGAALLPAGATAASATAVGIAATGLGISTLASVQQRNQSKRSIRAQQAIAERQNARERKQQIRQARIARAAQIAGGEAAGVGLGSSAVQGAAAGISAQLAANLSFLDQTAANQSTIFSAESKKATWGAIGGIASQVASDFGGFKTIFSEYGKAKGKS